MYGQSAIAECVTLGNLAYVLDFEQEVEVIVSGDVTTLDLTPGLERQDMIRLFVLNDSFLSEISTPDSTVLFGNFTLHYGTFTGEADADGEVDVVLNGWIDGNSPLGVICSPTTSADGPHWCLPMLSQLRPKAEGCATEGE
jgi:hypothetical protein